ncbi:MAG: hypothetical protein A3H35_05240 [Betaproteobacteria bacterium RIFCSPLOWO2_02_FULL_62_17]|nr:MAG: hypothetical protein A3H35_05240 [Betaproteobacteria bacterium RIFCSPLOWO2_02_FULL_62_17]
MPTRSINVTHVSQVAVIWLNRPDVRNAIDGVMVRELDATLAALETDRSVRAVVLAGVGPVFCAGIDVRWMKRMAGSSLAVNTRDALGMARLLHRLDCMPMPTLARVHGAAYAGALGIIAACDIAVASLEAEFCVSETRLGLAAMTIAPYLVRAIGERQARRYVLSGEAFTAAEAYRIGLVHELAPQDELDARINGILGHLMLGSPKALPAAKEVIAQLTEDPESKDHISAAASQLAKMRASGEAKEGISAFLEKRRPSWVRQGIPAIKQQDPLDPATQTRQPGPKRS